MRPITQEVYGVPRERVIGSATALAYTSDERGGTITHTPAPDYLDDGPEKPIRSESVDAPSARSTHDLVAVPRAYKGGRRLVAGRLRQTYRQRPE